MNILEAIHVIDFHISRINQINVIVLFISIFVFHSGVNISQFEKK